MRRRNVLRGVAVACCGAVMTLAAATSAMAAATEARPASPVRAHLTITYQASPDSVVLVWKLTCEPAGGTHPAPAKACARLAEIDDPFAPVPPDRICIPMYEPDVATVRGTIAGTKEVSAEFDRHNSCEIHRWDNHVPIIPSADR